MAKGIGTPEILEDLEKQTEKVKVEVEVPIGIAEFLERLAEVPFINVPTLREFAEQAVVLKFQAMLDGMAWTIFDYGKIHKWYALRDYPHKTNTTPKLPNYP